MSKYFYPQDTKESTGNVTIDLTKVAIAAVGGFVLMKLAPGINKHMETLRSETAASEHCRSEMRLRKEEMKLQYRTEKMEKELALNELLHKHEMESKEAELKAQLELEKEKWKQEKEKMEKELALKESMHQQELEAKERNLEIQLEIEREKRFAEEDRRATAEANASYRKSKANGSAQ